MVELTVGSRFYYGDKLCEVKEGECGYYDCVLVGDTRKCEKAKCLQTERHDDKSVHFEEVLDD